MDVGDAIASLDAAVRDLGVAVALSNDRPRPLTKTASAVATSNGCLIVFDSCPNGRMWDLRAVTVGGVGLTTAAAGNPFIVFSASPQAYQGSVANIPITDCPDATGATATLPNTSFYGTGRHGHLAPLAPRECLVVAISSATSGQTYSARAQFDDYPLS